MTTILHIIWGLEAGGKERFLYQLVRGLDPKQFTNAVWTLRAKGALYEKLRNEGCTVRHLEKRPGLDLRAVQALRRDIRALQPDLIHVQDFTSAFAALAALGLRKTPPLVMTLHGGHMDLPWPKGMLNTLLMRRAAAVTVVSKHMAGTLHERLGSSVAVTHIPLGIDATAFAGPASEPDPRREPGTPPDRPLVVSVMRLEEPKDPQLILRAAQRVVRDSPRCRFLIVGEGALRPELTALIRKLELEDHVFLPGYRSDVPAILAQANVCVLASRREGLPLSILEYMAAGKPVVATRVGGVDELVINGTSGYLVEAGDAAAMADRIVSLLDYPPRARAFGAKGRELVRTRFTEPAMIAAYEALYTTLIRSPPGTPSRTRQ